MADQITFSTDHLERLTRLTVAQEDMARATAENGAKITEILAKMQLFVDTYRTGHEEHAAKIRELEAAELSSRVSELEKIVSSGRGMWILLGVVGGALTLLSLITAAVAAMLGLFKPSVH